MCLPKRLMSVSMSVQDQRLLHLAATAVPGVPSETTLGSSMPEFRRADRD